MTDPNQDRQSVSVAVFKKENRRWFRLLAIVGICLTLLEYGLSWYTGEDMDHLRLFLSTCFAFVGLYGMDPKSMAGAGTLIYTWTSGIITIVWPSRRKSDKPGTVVVAEIDPSSEPPTIETRTEPPPAPRSEG